MVTFKQILLTVSLAFCLGNVNAQKSKEIKMKSADFEKAYRLQDVIKDIPSDCKVKSYELSVVIAGSEKSVELEGEVLSNDIKAIFAQPGRKIFIQRITTSCTAKHKTKYTVILE